MTFFPQKGEKQDAIADFENSSGEGRIISSLFGPFPNSHFASRNKVSVLNFREMEMALLLRAKLLTLLHKSHAAGAIVEDIFLVDFQAVGCFATVVLEIECQE